MNVNSIRFKSSVLYSVILAIILSVFSGVIYLSIRSILYHDLDRDLRIKAEELANIMHLSEQLGRGDDDLFSFMMDILKRDFSAKIERGVFDDLWAKQVETLELKKDYIGVFDVHGRALIVSSNFSKETAEVFQKQLTFSRDSITYSNLSNSKFKLRAINMPIPYQRFHLIIQLATPLRPVSQVLNKILITILAMIIAFLVITSFMGRVLTRRILQPVSAVAKVANKISYQNLNVKVDAREVDDEMKYLVDSFNVMLSRLNASFKHINEFSSHVAHELKTPLAIIKGEIELALTQNRSVEEYKSMLTNCLEELNHTVKTIGDLLFLSRLDYNPEGLRFERFNFKDFIYEVYGHLEVLASSKNIVMKLSLDKGNLFVNGNKIHLRRLFFNLVDNAIKYTPEGGQITIDVKSQYPEIVINISDTGIGIAADDLHKVFSKFFRVRDKDSSHEFSVGLGLSIARSVAQAHNGEIKLKSQQGNGTTVTVSLPLA